MSKDKPSFNVYTSRKRPWDRFRRTGTPRLDEIDRQARKGQSAPTPPDVPPPPAGPPMRTYRAGGDESAPSQPRRPRSPGPRGGGALAGAGAAAGGVAVGIGSRAARFGFRRALKWLLVFVVFWLLLSAVLFFVSSSTAPNRIGNAADAVLGGGGNMVTSPSTILVLGLDVRPKGSKEPGASTTSGRSDSIMLMRVGGGKAQRLSILRDSYAQIPGYPAQKINAAYAIGGLPLAVRTVEGFIGGGLKINHVIIVDFQHFPDLINALGGVDVKVAERCVKSTFSGMKLYWRRGEHHMNGRQALAYSRVRKNACVTGEDDRQRAAHQQQVLSAMKSKAFSPFTFFRLPWIAWNAPRAIVTDMSPPSLAAFMASMTLGPTPKTHVLQPGGPGPGNSLLVTEGERAAALQRFEK